MLGALTIGSLTIRPRQLRALNEQLECIAELTERCIESCYDRKRLDSQLLAARTTLKAQSAMSAVAEKV